ncbi:MAG: hypothetical protein BWK78_06700 [Thiotrichaceae bacterium IS1]|nr:MAG: hypothetical protein BWK78_06700 [Thiotrichaceae bacterium IS1]
MSLSKFKPIILCVDDEKIVLDSLKAQLRDEFGDAYLYEVAENGSDAIEVMETLEEEGKTIAMILSDWLMPGIKGDELLVQIHQKFPSMVKVMLTGQADQPAIERAKQEAALYRCLAKPWTHEELVETIRTGMATS